MFQAKKEALGQGAQACGRIRRAPPRQRRNPARAVPGAGVRHDGRKAPQRGAPAARVPASLRGGGPAADMSGCGWWCLAGHDPGGRRFAGLPEGPLLVRGTLALGLDPETRAESGAVLLDLATALPWAERLTIARMAGGGFALGHRVGTGWHAARLGPRRPGPAAALRLIWTWDAPARLGRLTAEEPATGRLRQVETAGAMPVGLAVLAPLLTGGALPPGLDWIALSDRVEPVGPRPGLPPATRLRTPEGPVPIAAIRPGMRVLTRDAGYRPVLWQGAAALPLAGSDRPVRLCAPFLGLEQDLVVAPDLRILLGGPTAEYLFGVDEVLVAARHLVDGQRAVVEEPSAPLLHQILLDRHHAIQASGLWVESLCVGTLAGVPDLLPATVLADLPAALVPRHGAAVRRTLRPFEAAALLAAGGPVRARPAA